MLDHRRRRGARPGACRPARALPVRRLLQAAASSRRKLSAGKAKLRAQHVAEGRQPVLVRGGRARPRLRRLARRARSTASSRDERRGARTARHHARPGREPRPVTRCPARTRGSSAATRRGSSTPARPRRAPRGCRRRGRGARRRRRDRGHARPPATTSRGCWRCASGSAARGSARAATPPTCGSATAIASARSRSHSVPGHAADHLAFVWQRRLLHRRRRARRGQRVRRRGPRRVPRGAAAPAPAPAARDLPRPRAAGVGPARKLDEYVAHRRERERKLLDALEDGLRGEDELLDARLGRRAAGPAAGRRGHAGGTPSEAGVRGSLASARRRYASAIAAASGVVPAASASSKIVRSVPPTARTRSSARSGA